MRLPVVLAASAGWTAVYAQLDLGEL
jgi:hypothetical protein